MVIFKMQKKKARKKMTGKQRNTGKDVEVEVNVGKRVFLPFTYPDKCE